MRITSILTTACASLLVACALSAPLPPDPAPGPNPPPADFAAQVELGKSLYGLQCASCHGVDGEGVKAPRVVGLKEGALPLDPPDDRKLRKGQFVTVADVGHFMVANMPPLKGGSLEHEQYLAILAFDLKANGLDVGPERLTMERAATIVIPR